MCEKTDFQVGILEDCKQRIDDSEDWGVVKVENKQGISVLVCNNRLFIITIDIATGGFACLNSYLQGLFYIHIKVLT